MSQIVLSFEDQKRMSRQREAILDIMRGWPGQWLNIGQLVGRLSERGISCVPTGASACLRDLRKPKFGGHQIDRRCVRPGHFEFRIWAR